MNQSQRILKAAGIAYNEPEGSFTKKKKRGNVKFAKESTKKVIRKSRLKLNSSPHTYALRYSF